MPDIGRATVAAILIDCNLNSSRSKSWRNQGMNVDHGIWFPFWSSLNSNAPPEYYMHTRVNDNQSNATFADGHADFVRAFLGVTATHSYTRNRDL